MGVRISLIGRVSIESNGSRLDERSLPGRQGRLVLAYLLAAEGRAVPRDELADLLWGEAPPARWEKALSVLVSKLRGRLAECGVDGQAALRGAFGCYQLVLPAGSWIDVAAAREAAGRSKAALDAGDIGAVREAAGEAVALARRRFLPGEDGPWVEEKRRELSGLLVQGLDCLADACLAAGDAREAVRHAEELTALEPYRESGYRRLMQAHAAAGNPAEALRVYERCRRFLADELGSYPSPETEAVYLEILRAGPASAVERDPALATPARRQVAAVLPVDVPNPRKGQREFEDADADVGRTLVVTGESRIQLCGKFVVELNGRRIESLLPARQGRVLFAFLALNRLRPLDREELVDVLWGKQVPDAADVALRALVSKLRGVLGERVIQGRAQLQLVLPQDVWIDFEAAFEAIHRAEAAVTREQWHDAWWPTRIALNIGRRKFLAGAGSGWIEECQRRLDDLRLRAHEAVAAVGLGLGGSELVSAERSALALIEAAPFRESGYRFLMQTYATSGNVAEALLVYDRLRCLLRDELGVVPARRTQLLHRRILEASD